MKVRYELNPAGPCWCLTHHRNATHLRIREGCERPDLNPPEPCCDPDLAGITMTCRCVPLAARDFAQSLEDRRLPNPDWVEPADGEIVSVLMTCEGSKKGVYNARTKQIEWSPFTFSDMYGPDGKPLDG